MGQERNLPLPRVESANQSMRKSSSSLPAIWRRDERRQWMGIPATRRASRPGFDGKGELGKFELEFPTIFFNDGGEGENCF